MVAIVVLAILFALFRAFSFVGVVALVPFGIAAVVAWSASNPPAHRRALAIGVIGTLLLPFLAAIWINHEMWGYYMRRPSVERRIVEATDIKSITRVESRSDARGRDAFVGSTLEDIAAHTQRDLQGDDYYLLEDRVLVALKARRALPEAPEPLSADRLNGLYALLNETGRLEHGESEYTDAKKLAGIVVEAVGPDGRPLIFVGARGGQVSNDHYPYYEFLFTGASRGGPLTLLSFQRFYYDVAGLEGAEWPSFFPVLALVGLIPTIAIQGMFLLAARR
jgi:hypothetical protein